MNKIPLLLLALLGLGPAAGASAQPLLVLDEAPPGADAPAGWEVATLGDAPRARSEVVADLMGRPALVLSGAGEAVRLGLRLEETLDATGGRLRWSWLVLAAIPGAELTDPARDDAPIRVAVVFGEGGLFTPPRTLFYSWGGAGDERTFRSHVSDRIGVVVLRDAASPTGRWLEESRDLVRDHRAVFGEEPEEPVTGVGVVLDSDQMGVSARAALSGLEWVRNRAPPR